MKTYLLFPLITASIAGCAGVDITPISPAEEAAAHAGGGKLKGYIVYEPMVVVEVTQKQVGTTITCSAGTPFILPDTSRPFLVNARSGLGKAGVDVTIVNGWQLGNIKDSSDNTALLGTVEKILGVSGVKEITREGPAGKCKEPGLYRVNLEPRGVTLSRLLVY